MQIIPIEASLFKTYPKETQALVIDHGGVPVNDIFFPIWDNTNKINLLYGSYGSGKSVFIVDKLLSKAIEQPYFRCYYGRKILDKVRGSVFQTIIDRIKDRKLESRFSFSDKPNGTMVIVCKENGNQFIPFGADNTESMKSIKDPTDFFCEEMDQFTFEDFGFLYSRLRKEGVLLQFWGSFNTERVYQSHWIRKVLFDGQYSKDAFKLKANYYDNHFINQDDYLSKLQMIANGDATRLNAIAHGEWGIVRTGGEFWKQFDETRHVKKVNYESGPIHISLDENVNPYVTCTVWQIVGKEIRQLSELLCRSPENNAPKAAQRILKYLDQIGHNNIVYLYGDPSASRRSTVDPNNRSFYDKLIEVLQQAKVKVINRVSRSAPEVALSAAFINDIYESNYDGWSIVIGDTCFESIEDYILVKEDMNGKMLKPKVKDPETGVTYEPAGHISDTKRYFIISILADVFSRFSNRSLRKFYITTE